MLTDVKEYQSIQYTAKLILETIYVKIIFKILYHLFNCVDPNQLTYDELVQLFSIYIYFSSERQI